MQYLPKPIQRRRGLPSLLYRKSLIYAIKTYYILVFFVVRGFYAYQLKQGHQKPSKPAELARRSGVRYGTLSKFEVGRTETLSMKNIAKVASGLGMTVSEFFEGLEDEPGYSEYIDRDKNSK